MERRQYLEAALSAVGYPLSTDDATEDATAPVANVSEEDEYGLSLATIQSGSPVRARANLTEVADDETEVEIKGYTNGNGPETVECNFHIQCVHPTICFSPERARELAAELCLAAAHAEGEELPAEVVDDGE